MAELEDIQQQIEVLRRREREIVNEREKIFLSQQEEAWKLVKDKIFCSIGSSGNQRHITIMKTLSCTNFNSYNSCNVLKMTFRYDGDKFESFSCKKDTYRVDSLMLKDNYKKGNQYANEITAEEVVAYQKQAVEEIIKAFNLIQ